MFSQVTQVMINLSTHRGTALRYRLRSMRILTFLLPGALLLGAAAYAGAQTPPAPSAAPPGAAAKPEPPKWDVNNPPGPRKTITIDTTTGTWINLDVSPDGKEIVFDLLGDLHSLPIAGGTARSLTSGMAWDMQPRFAPDGKKIAFTSDRAGGDNIWLIDRDGTHPHQVTKDSVKPGSPPTALLRLRGAA